MPLHKRIGSVLVVACALALCGPSGTAAADTDLPYSPDVLRPATMAGAVQEGVTPQAPSDISSVSSGLEAADLPASLTDAERAALASIPLGRFTGASVTAQARPAQVYPLPVFLGAFFGQKVRDGQSKLIGCLLLLASDTPYNGQGNTRYIEWGITVQCNDPAITGYTSAQLREFPGNALLDQYTSTSIQGGYGQFGSDGTHAPIQFDYDNFTRTSDTQLESIVAKIRLTIDGTAGVDGWYVPTGNGVVTCDTALKLTINCDVTSAPYPYICDLGQTCGGAAIVNATTAAVVSFVSQCSNLQLDGANGCPYVYKPSLTDIIPDAADLTDYLELLGAVPSNDGMVVSEPWTFSPGDTYFEVPDPVASFRGIQLQIGVVACTVNITVPSAVTWSVQRYAVAQYQCSDTFLGTDVQFNWYRGLTAIQTHGKPPTKASKLPRVKVDSYSGVNGPADRVKFCVTLKPTQASQSRRACATATRR